MGVCVRVSESVTVYGLGCRSIRTTGGPLNTLRALIG